MRNFRFRKPLQAESHRVLYQSYKHFPYVSQIFVGPQMGIWALVNPLGAQSCTSESGLPEDVPKVKNRVVKLLRYNQRINDF